MTKEIVVNNSQFGTLSIEEEKVITFPQGIFGFEELTRYAILVFEEYEPFQFLISIDEPEISFPVISPLLAIEKYEPKITKEDIALIGDFKDEDLIMYAIVTIKSDSKEVTANLKGPVVINQKERLAQQVVIESDEYSMEHPFM